MSRDPSRELLWTRGTGKDTDLPIPTFGGIVAEQDQGPVNAPDFGPGEWINSIPHSIRDLRGRVVLVDFWDYTCVNCIRSLTVVGVHTPEFSFAGQRGLVEEAVKRFDLPYPILIDRDFQTWQAYANRYWPAKYFIDTEGRIRAAHFGEGGYEESERKLQELLREREGNKDHEFPEPMQPVRAEDAPGAVCYRVTPETYLGFRRGLPGNPDFLPGAARIYQDHGAHMEATAYFEGPWQVADEYAARPFGFSTDQPSRLHLRYTSKDVNLVIHPGTTGKGEIALLHEGQPLAAADCGEAARSQGGRTTATVAAPRMYRLISNQQIASRELTLETVSDGVALYAFTFTSCLVPGNEGPQ
jgi:Thioredoxin like C-terminal domain